MGFSKLTFKKNYKTKIKKLNMTMSNRNLFFPNCTKSSKMEWPPIDSKQPNSLVRDKDNYVFSTNEYVTN
jgi:hypothetical protein